MCPIFTGSYLFKTTLQITDLEPNTPCFLTQIGETKLRQLHLLEQHLPKLTQGGYIAYACVRACVRVCVCV